MLSKILVMVSMTKDYIDGTYDKPPVSTVLTIVASLIYLVSVVDLIPDAIPGIGYIDDVAVLSACWKIINMEINQYMMWKNIKLYEARKIFKKYNYNPNDFLTSSKSWIGNMMSCIVPICLSI